MPRRAAAQIRPLEADPIHRSKLVQQVINKVMLDGKKSIAERIVYDALALLGERSDGRHQAERSVRASLRELARCVLVAGDLEEALHTAERANEIVTRAVGWCLEDDRPGAAVGIAEAGRSLVLASVVLSGQVEEVLRGAGEQAAADAWRRGDASGRLTGLDALWKTRFGDSLLGTPGRSTTSIRPAPARNTSARAIPSPEGSPAAGGTR